MNHLQKCFAMGLLAIAALVVGASPARAQGSTAPLSEFAFLVSANPICTAGPVVAGGVCVVPGSVVPFIRSGCTASGTTHLESTRPQLRRALLSVAPAQRSGACIAPHSQPSLRVRTMRPLFTVPML